MSASLFQTVAPSPVFKMPAQHTSLDLNDPAQAQLFLNTMLARGERGMFTEVIHITPVLASLFLTLNCRNRQKRLADVKKYEKIIRQGRWILTSQGISVGDDRILNNGQHRLTAIINTDTTVPVNVTFGEDPKAFNCIDRQRTRSGSDTLAVLGENYVTSLAAGLKLIHNIERGAPRSLAGIENDEVEPLLEQHPGLRETQAAGKRISKNLRCSSTGASVALYYISKSRHHDRADDFVEKLVTGANLDAKDPILVLRKKLSNRTGLKSHEITALMIKCWNAWVKRQRPSSFNFTANEDFPTVI